MSTTIKETKVQEGLNKFIEYIKDRYGKNIILINVVEKEYSLNEDGLIEKRKVDEKKVTCEYNFDLFLLEKLSCYYIKMPNNTITDKLHPWGESNVHYISEYYEYVYNAIMSIVNTRENNNDLGTKLDQLWLNYSILFHKIINKEVLSTNNTIKRVNNLLKSNKIQQGLNLLDKLIDQNNIKAIIEKCKIYKEGRYVEKNIEKCIKTLEESIKQFGEIELIYYYVDTIIELKISNNRFNIIDLMTNPDYNGNGEMEGRIGRAYWEGINCVKDLTKAKEWMLKSVENNIKWAEVYYFDILKEINTNDSKKELIYFSKKSNNSEIKARLARCYRDGYGVKRDLNMAAKLMYEATIYTYPVWAQWEYWDILWSINTNKNDEMMITYGKPKAEKGIKEFEGRMGRAYRDGRGVKKNTSLAAMYLKRAYEKNLWWAKVEYVDILKEINDKESLEEMVEILKKYENGKESWCLGRLGYIYENGIIEETNIKKATEYYREACNKD